MAVLFNNINYLDKNMQFFFLFDKELNADFHFSFMKMSNFQCCLLVVGYGYKEMYCRLLELDYCYVGQVFHQKSAIEYALT